MTTTPILPGSGSSQPTDEATCRRLMICLFGEKAEGMGTLLLHSAELKSSESETKRLLEFDAFMEAVYRRADATRDLDSSADGAIPKSATVGSAAWRARARESFDHGDSRHESNQELTGAEIAQ